MMRRMPSRAASWLVLLLAPLLLWRPCPGGDETQSADDGVDAWRADHTTYGCRAGRLERLARAGDARSQAFDEATGRDLRNFPPDRVIDYAHMKLQMRFEDLNAMRFTATETLRFVPIGKAVSSITLDAGDLKIESVRLGENHLEYYQDDKTLTLRFDPSLPPAEEQRVVIEYVCEKPYDGMFFTPSVPQAPNYTPEVHTQGQTETNHLWFITHDFPNERLTTELIVDVPAELLVSSNGELVSHLISGNRAVWHYLQDEPHVAYLVSLVIGTFDVVDIPHERVPMKVWVPRGMGDRVERTYGRTGEMIDVFERRFGIAYPWARYDQLAVKNFGSGGMENTSATTMYPTAVLDETALLDGDLEGLISHELAHQWTGDLITCKSWAHIWLNEGWATYGSALWFEHRDGEDGYLDSIRRSFGVAKRDKTTNEIPMVSPVYDDPWETFGRAADPYPKGSAILHMLRRMLGDDVFWAAVGLYMNRHAFGLVETNDFRYALEEVSGLGLEWFFEQWCYRPGTPELDVKVSYDAEARRLAVDVEQTQQIDARTPAFRFTLPVVARTASGDQVLDIHVRETKTSFRAPLEETPSLVAVDPYLDVLKTITVDKPQNMWIAQIEGGPTIAARHAAIEGLGRVDSPETIELLSGLIHDASLRHTLRITAVEALAGYGSAEARAALHAIARDGVDDARVRVKIVSALKDSDKDEVVGLLAEFARNDPSYATRVAAIEGLAHHEATEHAELIAQLVHFRSQHEQVRSAALKALADLDERRGLELGMRHAAYGNMDRARPAAIEAIGKLAKHDADRAIPFLIKLLNDPERRTVRAAGEALAETGDERAVAPIRAIAETHRNPRLREEAEKWLKKLEGEEEEEESEEEEE
ncbi:MAG: M1 family aminopeptidase [Planctomycetota bacterium]